jgi:hypothetical protein
MMKLGLLNKALATVAMAAIIPMIAFAAPPYDGSGSTPLALKGGKIYRITSPPIDSGTIIIRNGLIEEVGGINQVTIPSDAVVVDMAGKSILPGIIDAHSHMGVYSWPGVEANSDGNEATAPVTAQVRAEDGINLEDPAFARARAGGVTTVMVLPGSANIIGGEGVVLKLKTRRASLRNEDGRGTPPNENGDGRKSEACLWRTRPASLHAHGHDGQVARGLYQGHRAKDEDRKIRNGTRRSTRTRSSGGRRSATRPPSQARRSTTTNLKSRLPPRKTRFPTR